MHLQAMTQCMVQNTRNIYILRKIFEIISTFIKIYLSIPESGITNLTNSIVPILNRIDVITAKSKDT